MATPRLPHLLWGPPEVSPRRPRVLLGCSGSVATIKVPALVEQLEQRGAHVIVVPTRSALHFLRAAAEGEVHKPPVTPTTAGTGDAEIDAARSELPSALANAKTCNRYETENSEGLEVIGVGEFYDAYCTLPCQSTLQCYKTRCSGLEKEVQVDNMIQKSEGDEQIQKKCCVVTHNSCTSDNSVQGALVHCCTKASDCRLTAGPDLRDKCSCDSVLRSSKRDLGFSTNAVQTQTEIVGVKCYSIRNSTVITNSSSNKSKPKTNTPSISNPADGARAPSHCLSCLKLLATTALRDFTAPSSTAIPSSPSSENKPSALASPQSSPGDLTRADSGAGGDSCSQFDRPSPNCAWCATQRLLPELVIAGDALEWEGWRGRGDPVLHIELRRWADLGVIAPLSANTLAKMANGLCDNLLTCVARAWDTNKPLLFCPAMNTHMYEHPLTARQITVLGELGYVEVPAVSKRLMCGDVGGGAMAEVGTVVEAVWNSLQQHRGPFTLQIESECKNVFA